MSNSLNTLKNKPLGTGQSIRDYQIQELCHEGKSATTYRARHERLGSEVSLRVDCEATDEETREQLKSWARELVALRHPTLAELTDFGFLDDKRFYCACGWARGLSLAQEQGLPARDKDFSELVHQMCSAVDALHEAGLSHGGLGPEAFVVHAGRSRLLCPSFAARHEGPAEDIRALGALLFQLLSRREAMDSGDTQDLRGRAKAPPELGEQALAELPEELAKVIARCTAADPAERYQSAAAIARDLDVALDLALDLPLDMALDIVQEHSDLPLPILKAGDLVGENYRITTLLGRGGMGQVYEAVHTRLPQRVAIKVIAGEYTEEALARFRREAEISSSLGHPHIVSVFDFNTLPDGKPYMVMEYLKGENLGATLKRGAMEVERALLIAKQLGSALAAAHDKGIVHRDLKPANIFLSQVEIAGEIREHATILDFGISKREDNSSSFTHSEAIIGTPQYMAPEQAKAEHDRVGAASDQFAFAAIVYEMLSGKAAFGRGTLAEIVYRVCHTEPPDISLLVPDLERPLVAAIERAMSKRREQRFDSVAHFVAALTSGESSSAVSVPEPAHDLEVEAEAAEEPQAEVRTVPNKKKQAEAQVAEAEAQVAEPSPRVPRALIAAGLGVLACAGIAFAWIGGGTSDREAPIAQGEALLADADGGAPVVPADAALQAVPLFDAAAQASDAAVASESASLASAKKPKEKAAPVAAEIEEAESLLASGRYRDARRLIQGAPGVAKTPRGYAVTVKSYCGEGNFGAAKDWLARVPRSGRAAVLRYCEREHAIVLD